MVSTDSTSSLKQQPVAVQQTQQFCASSQKANPQNIMPTLQYGSILSNVAPSQMYLFDQQAPSVSAANPTQSIGSSTQIIGSQLLPPRLVLIDYIIF